MMTAEEILREKINDVQGGIFSCEDKVCDVAHEIIAAMNEHAGQYIKQAMNHTTGKFASQFKADGKGEDVIVIEKWKFAEIEDALRMTSNIHKSKTKETAFDRSVIKAYEFCTEALSSPLKPISESKGETVEATLEHFYTELFNEWNTMDTVPFEERQKVLVAKYASRLRSECKGETGELFAENLNPYSPHCKWITPDFYNITGKHICDIIESDKPTEAKTKLIFNQFSSLRSSEPEREETRFDKKCVNIFHGKECVFPDCACDSKNLPAGYVVDNHYHPRDSKALTEEMKHRGFRVWVTPPLPRYVPSPPLKPLSEEITDSKVFEFLQRKKYQKEQGEQEYFMYFDVDMPKIIRDFVSEFYPIPSVKESTFYCFNEQAKVDGQSRKERCSVQCGNCSVKEKGENT